MSKEEFLKIQKCVLKVNIHCEGCKQKVKKILQKIDGVFATDIDAEQGKVIVSGNVDPTVLIKKLAKSGKHAELWGALKPNNNNNNHLPNQFKGMQIDNDKGGNNNKGQKSGNNQPKGGRQGQQQQQQQQLHQLQQMKGLQGLKLPQFKDFKMTNQNSNQKAAKFNLPEDEVLSDDEFDDEFDDEDFDEDDELDVEFDDPTFALNKMKPGMPMPNGLAANMMMNGVNGLHPQLMNAQMGGSAAVNGKKGDAGGGPVAVPIRMNVMGGEHDAKNGNVGKKGSGGGGGGGTQPNQGGKNGGGFLHEGKSGNNGGVNNKNIHGNGGAQGNNNGNGVKKGNGAGEGLHPTSNGFQNMGGHPAMAAAHMGPMGNMNVPPMAQMNSMSMGQTGSIPAVQGLPAAAMNVGGGAGYFQGSSPEVMAGNPYQSQQQYLTAMMNQQRAMGNDRFQPMMYARPPPAVNYMSSYPYYPPPPPADSYSHSFNDENASSCNVM